MENGIGTNRIVEFFPGPFFYFPEKFSPPQNGEFFVVDAFLSVSRDSRTAGLLLTNRSFAPEKVTFELSGPLAKRTIHSVVSDTLTGPNAYADNEKTANTVFLAPRKVTYSGKRVSVQLPPHSLTGITLRLQ